MESQNPLPHKVRSARTRFTLDYSGPVFPDDLKEPVIFKQNYSGSVAVFIMIFIYGPLIPWYLVASYQFVLLSYSPIPYIVLWMFFGITAIGIGIKSTSSVRKSPLLIVNIEGVTEVWAGHQERFCEWHRLQAVPYPCFFKARIADEFGIPFCDISNRSATNPHLARKLIRTIEKRDETHRTPSLLRKQLRSDLAILGVSASTILGFIISYHPADYFYGLIAGGTWPRFFFILSTLSLTFLIATIISIVRIYSILHPRDKGREASKNKSGSVEASELAIYVNHRKGIYIPCTTNTAFAYQYIGGRDIFRYSAATADATAFAAILSVCAVILFLSMVSPPPDTYPLSVSMTLLCGLSLFGIGKSLIELKEFNRTYGAEFRTSGEHILLTLAGGQTVTCTAIAEPKSSPHFPTKFGNRTIRLRGDDGRYYRYDPHFLVPILPGHITAKF